VTENGLSGQCDNGRGLVQPMALALSPNGANVYVASQAWDSVAILVRDPANGTLAPISTASGCLSSLGFYPDCTNARALGGARDVAISPDGKSVYVAAPDDDAVAVLDRDPDGGLLTQSPGTDGCVAAGGSDECVEGRPLDHPTSVVVSPDGKNVYVGSHGQQGGIAIFARDPDTGELSQEAGAGGCVDSTGDECEEGLAEMVGVETLEISPDGKTLYALSPARDAVTLYSRDPDTGALTPVPPPSGCIVSSAVDGCTVAIGLGDPHALAFSAGGENVYVASERRDAILVFDRDAPTGALTQKPGTDGCLSNTGLSDPMQAGTAGQCANGVAMDAIDSIAVLPDGTALYATAAESDGVVVFERAPDGAITQRPGTSGCITETGFEDADLPWTEGTCEDGRSLLQADGVVASADSGHVYSSARFGGISTFDVVAPPSPEQPAATPTPPPPTVSPACMGAREKARKISARLKTLSRENERRARKATFVTSEAAKERLNEAADRGRRRAKEMRADLRRANRAVRQLCL
jgi:DNA-binding beta-propeller fold protein YncE